MSALVHLRAIARGMRPADDGLLGNARCAWGGSDLLSEEAILAAFAADPIATDSECMAVETPQSAALVGQDWALVADVYNGRIGRLWRIGGEVQQEPEPHVDVAFDADMRQERGDLHFRHQDHPDLQPTAVEPLLSNVRSLVERGRTAGKLRVRAFAVRAFGDDTASAALLSLFILSNEKSRRASFSYAVVGLKNDQCFDVSDVQPEREWSPRL